MEQGAISSNGLGFSAFGDQVENQEKKPNATDEEEKISVGFYEVHYFGLKSKCLHPLYTNSNMFQGFLD